MFNPLFLIILLQLCDLSYGQNTECIQKDFGESSFVCVCNSTYCDEIGSVDKVPSGQYLIYTTSKDGARFQKTSNVYFDKNSPSTNASQVTLTIDHSKINQTIFGFGGAFTDATGQNIVKLSNATQQRLINAYFSPNGIEYTFGRVPIGGCDFSPRVYTYDDDHQGDLNLTHFQLAPEDLEYKIPFVQNALSSSGREIRLFASAWSAPAWMKTSGQISGNGTLLGEAGGPYYQTWADYYVRFLNEYKKYGIEFWAVTAQNEPEDGNIPFFPFNCMGFTPVTQRVFVETNLGPTLDANGYEDLKILMLDDNRDLLPSWTKEVLRNDSGARDYVDGIALHWYQDVAFHPSILSETHDQFPDKFLLATEACIVSAGPQKVHLGSWERGEYYATDIMQDLQHWVVGWVDWNMALNPDGGFNWMSFDSGNDSPVIVDGDLDEFYKQPMFYALGHFSKFVAPGSQVVGLQFTESDATLEAIAFDNAEEGATIIVVLNKSDSDVSVSIEDPSEGYVNEIVPSRSFQTYIWWH